jgi:hypothetical protein
LVCIYTGHLYLSVIHWSRHLMGSTVLEYFIFFINIIFLLCCICFDFKFNWAIWMDMIFRVWCGRPYSSLDFTLFYYIILFSRLIWDLGMSEGFSPLTPSWYRESREISFGPWLVQRGSNLLLYSFCHFTGSYLFLAIWQLKSYYIMFWFIMWGRLSDSADQSTCFITVTLLGCYRLGSPNCRLCNVIAA